MAFGLFRRASGEDGSGLEQVVVSRRVNCHMVPDVGTTLVTTPGHCEYSQLVDKIRLSFHTARINEHAGIKMNQQNITRLKLKGCLCHNNIRNVCKKLCSFSPSRIKIIGLITVKMFHAYEFIPELQWFIH